MTLALTFSLSMSWNGISLLHFIFRSLAARKHRQHLDLEEYAPLSSVLLDSTAVPTRVTDASGVSGYSHTSDNSTAAVPPFTDYSNDGPAKQQLVAHGIANDEERAPPVKLTRKGLQEITNEIRKTTLFKLYGGTSGPKLSLGGWDQALMKDEDLLRIVGSRTRPKADSDADMQRLVQDTTRARRRNVGKGVRNFKMWSSEQDMSPKGLALELNKRLFFQYFTFAKVRRLQKFLGSSEEATKTFFDTLSEGFGSELNFARFLSIEKQTLVNGREAKSLQDDLLKFWKENNKMPEEEVLELLNLLEEGWTYETLDTLVEYVALRDNQKPSEVYAETIRLIMRMYSDEEIIKAIDNGEKIISKSLTQHDAFEHDKGEVVLQAIEHTDLADELQKQLLREWKSDENGLNDVRREAIQRLGNKLDFKLSFDLSLMPPGT